MKIAASYSGYCRRCKGSFDKGALIEYNQDTKRVFHPYCVQEEGLGEESDEEKAERLGFKKA